ncbi:ABC transporter permease [Brucella grignonensis]|uniref:Binding-protein-dependent transport system inner membrane component family protein n=1 Tax=Brucella grignonensis TaxID=94627 RepID=A0A256F1I2_9HYPH|nr:ABC transporter permease [Brucella grignonensis]OYR08719.1 binding-protein-dependent transport system inner membrane component family protein [Brucella grignonensis]
MKLGTVLKTGLLGILCIFILKSEWFQSWLAPFTRDNAPAIYTQNSLLTLTINHLALVGITTLTATIIAVTLGILTTRPSGREFLPLSRAIANIGQTFPPVAVLAIAVPIFGFGSVPTFIALLLYGLLPIFENTLTGLTELEPSVIDAGRGMGMTDRQLLFNVELPLALPVILSGIRLTAIISLSTATIGSTVAASTLGEVIVAGLLSGNTAFVLQGGFIVAALAVLINAAFVYAEQKLRSNTPH